MARRFALSPVVSVLGPGGRMTLQAKARVLGRAAGMTVGRTWVRPPMTLGEWALTRLDGDDFSTLQADPDVDLIPGIALTTRLSSLTTTQRNTLTTRLTARGVSTTGLTGTNTIGDVVQRVMQTLSPQYAVADVSTD